MKKMIIPILFSVTLHAQTFTDKLTKELKFEKVNANNTLVIANLNGSMKVEGYDGDKIIIEAEQNNKGENGCASRTGKKGNATHSYR
ncbi:MAG: hypothetical protein QM734_10525 [Cyclobacteriaceae bacterium]